MKTRTLLAGLVAGALSVSAGADIIAPTYVDAASTPDALISATETVNNNGMLTAVNGGDSLASALAAAHDFSGAYNQSWVTNAPTGGDYFDAGVPNPTLVYDLTGGGDTTIGSILLWQYQNDGGGTAVGNHARTIEVRINTDAQGTGSFAGPAQVLTLDSVLALGGTNSAQAFGLGGDSGRYVQLTFTDNHFGDPDGQGVAGGGDRVGIGEVRFATEVVPEPGSLALLGLGGLALLRRRRA
ncbi:MAG: PEP-CTERM sorting domain-containing protein [Phycisphaerales bacterium JB063]